MHSSPPSKGGTAIQLDGAARGVDTIPRRRRLNEVLVAIAAIVVIAAMMALVVVWAAPLASSGVGAEDAKAGSAVIRDDAGEMKPHQGPKSWRPLPTSGEGWVVAFRPSLPVVEFPRI